MENRISSHETGFMFRTINSILINLTDIFLPTGSAVYLNNLMKRTAVSQNTLLHVAIRGYI